MNGTDGETLEDLADRDRTDGSRSGHYSREDIPDGIENRGGSP